MIKIKTTCGMKRSARAEECPEEITFDLEGTFEEASETYDFVKTFQGTHAVNRRPEEGDEFTICFGVECSACKALLEWPQAWTLAEEPSDSFECSTCGERVEYADLGAVFEHEHRGLTVDPKVKDMFDQIGPGKRVK